MTTYRAAAAAIIEHSQTHLGADDGLWLTLVRAWTVAGDPEKARQAASVARRYKVEALIQLGGDLGFSGAKETAPPLLDEALGEIGALDRPLLRDSRLSDLAGALRKHGQYGSALQVVRAIRSPCSRCQAAVGGDQHFRFDQPVVGEALKAMAEIEDVDDREAAGDWVAGALAVVGWKADALALITEVRDDFERCRRQLRVAEGFFENGDSAAAAELGSLAAEGFCGRMSGGLSDGLYGDAALLFARLGQFDRAAAVFESSACHTGYVAAKIQEVCGLLLDAGRHLQALSLAQLMPDPAEAAPVLAAIAEDRYRAGERERALQSLGEVASNLLGILARESGYRGSPETTAHASDRSSVEHRATAALNKVATVLYRTGDRQDAIALLVRPMPEGAGPTLFSLQSVDLRVFAVEVAAAGDLDTAKELLERALVCGQAVSTDLPHERAERLGELLVPELLVGRPEGAGRVWEVVEESHVDRVSFLNACLRIAMDCASHRVPVPDNLLARILAAITFA